MQNMSKYWICEAADVYVCDKSGLKKQPVKDRSALVKW